MFIARNVVSISRTPLGVQCADGSILINVSLLKECQVKCLRVFYKHLTTTWLGPLPKERERSLPLLRANY